MYTTTTTNHFFNPNINALAAQRADLVACMQGLAAHRADWVAHMVKLYIGLAAQRADVYICCRPMQVCLFFLYSH